MRILSLNTNPGFEDNESWHATTTGISTLVMGWHQKSTLSKASSLLRVAWDFDAVLFHLDLRLAILFGLAQGIFAPGSVSVFQGFLCDTSRYARPASVPKAIRNKASYLVHWLFVRSMTNIIVHTKAEIELYADVFHVPASRFTFIPYFHYGDFDETTSGDRFSAGEQEAEATVVAIGRHRDFECFVSAMTASPWQGVIVAGNSDRAKLEGNIPANVVAHYEVSRALYREYIANATVIVIPFYADRWHRALGQIAMFEAMLLQKPVIAARTFQLTDYASDDEILYYRPGDSNHLREQIDRLMGDPELRRRLAQNAGARLRKEFTRERFIARLIGVCQALSDSRNRHLPAEARRARA